MKSSIQIAYFVAFLASTRFALSDDLDKDTAWVFDLYQKGAIGKKELGMFFNSKLTRALEGNRLRLANQLAISNKIVYEQIEKQKREEMKPVLEERTIQFLKQRTTNGSPEAAFEVYERYRDGKGVNQDASEAFRYLMISAANGNEKAMAILTSGKWKNQQTNSSAASIK